VNDRALWAALAALGTGLAAVAAWPLIFGRVWLAALFFWSSLPVASLAFCLMMRLIPGRWADVLGPAARRGALSLPAVAIGFVAILLGGASIYPWVREPLPGFRGAWLEPAFWMARSLLWFVGLGSILLATRLLRRVTAISATLGLLFFIPATSLIAVDWLMSLAPGFHSSGFGLQALAIQFIVALAVAVLRSPPDPSGTTGALMLALLVLWGYFAYLPFFIIWSSNPPAGAAWYLARGSGGWGAVAALAAVLHAVPLLALLAPSWRRSGSALKLFALAVLVGNAVQTAWLVLPTSGPVHAASLLAYALALALLGVPALLIGRRS